MASVFSKAKPSKLYFVMVQIRGSQTGAWIAYDQRTYASAEDAQMVADSLREQRKSWSNVRIAVAETIA